MCRVRRYVQTMIRQTEAQISEHRNASPPDLWLIRFLEGRLEAFHFLECYLDRLDEEDVLLHGSASAFSPQG